MGDFMRVLSTISLCFLASLALADEPTSVSYYCAAEFAGGLRFDEAAKRWGSTEFVPRDKFLLKVTDRSAVQADGHKLISVSVTPSGSSNGAPCVQDGNYEMQLWPRGMIRCNSMLTDYVFNVKDNRFLAAYSFGFVDGEDAGGNTPSMTGGYCTKI